jgi:preprotein translocase subunit SecD
MKHLLTILSLLTCLSVSANNTSNLHSSNLWNTAPANKATQGDNTDFYKEVNDKPEVVNPDSLLYTGWYYITDSITKFRRQLEKTNEFFYVIPKPIASAKDIIRIAIYDRKEGGYGLIMKLGDKGTNAWSNATYKWVNKRLGFILDNKLLEVDYVNSEITGGTTALIQGNFTKEELEKFKEIIEREQ